MPKSIAIYSHSIAPTIDGVCRRYTAILHELVRQGYKVLLFTVESEPEDLPEKLPFVTLDSMTHISYPGKKVAYPSFHNLWLIFQGLREHNVDFVHMSNDGFSHMFAMAGLLLGIPVVGSFHTDMIEYINKTNRYWIEKVMVFSKEFVDSVTLNSCATTSNSFLEKLSSMGICCQHIIVTSVDPKVFHPSKRSSKIRKEVMFGNEKGFLCVYVGRLSPEKRLDIIIEAIQNIDNAYLVIVGDGPSASTYAEIHSKENKIYCKPGFLDHIGLAEMYASSDVHVSASEFETLGNTVLEAHACGIPVVVPRTQGFCDTVSDSVNGYLFEPGNFNSAKEYLEKIKGDTKLKERLGKSALESIQNNTISRVVEDLLTWWDFGMKRFEARYFIYKIAIGAVLCFTIPLAVVSHAMMKTIAQHNKDKLKKNS